MKAQEPPRCPKCRFIVFNRRLSKCESCGAELAPGLLYSEAELEALRKSEAEQLEHELERQREASKEATATLRHAALMSRVAGS